MDNHFTSLSPVDAAHHNVANDAFLHFWITEQSFFFTIASLFFLYLQRMLDTVNERLFYQNLFNLA